MLDHEDLKWIATTSTDLNSMLQQISRYADLARQHKGEYNYIELLGERVELASKTAQALFDRVTSAILTGSAERASSRPNPSRTPSFTVVPPPAEQTTPAATTPKAKAGRAVSRAKASASDQKKTASSPAGEIPPDIKVLNRKGNRELILLVEDEVEIGELAAQMLTDEGYRVILARDGFEALRVYQQIGKHIGLVILDFFLPVMDGDAVFDELRALNPNAAVVLSSGFAEQSKLGNMLSQGLRGFIPKPYTRDKLLEQVRSTLDSTRQAVR
jgi:CheY-like chemotaxis protein